MKKRTSFILKNIIGIITAAVLILIDQITKYAAVNYLKGKPSFVILEGILELQYSENRGAAFGILQNKQMGLIIITFIILIGVIALFEITPNKKRMIPIHAVYILIVSGAIGNMIDRISQDYVVDFIYFKIINFPNFNFADICVTCGCALLIFLMLFYYKDDEQLIIISKKVK